MVSKSSKIVVTFSPSNRGFMIEIREKEAINQVLARMSKIVKLINFKVR